MTDRNMQALAEARLAPLIKEGLGEVVGVSHADGREQVFIALSQTIDAKDPAYRTKMEIIRARLKVALREIPFTILGHYDDAPSEMLERGSQSQPTSLQPPTSRESLPPARIDNNQRTLVQPPEQDQVEGLKAAYRDIQQLRERTLRLESHTARLPSKGFVLSMTLLNLILVTLIVLFQAQVLTLVGEVLPALHSVIASFN
jgi:hypothetical protein